MVKLAQIISYPGPLFFIQDRIGRDGKLFRLYKFRTMLHSSESELAKNVLKSDRSLIFNALDAKTSKFLGGAEFSDSIALQFNILIKRGFSNEN